MSVKIEFHMIQSFPPANLNRDDTNMPKDCDFGGVRRARISSQCLKRAIRLHPDFEKYTNENLSSRSRRLSERIEKKLVENGYDGVSSHNVALVFTAELLGGIDEDDIETGKSRVIFFFTPNEIDVFVNLISSNWQEINKIVSSLDINKHIVNKFSKPKDRKLEKYIKEYIKEFKNQKRVLPDIALFGRMLALQPELSLEASCQVAHAISTHHVNMEMDFFTAIDDLQQSEDMGASMMGITGFNAATFYRYAAIDWGQLVENLGGDAGLAKKTVRAFVFAMAKAVPTGKQNAFAAQTPPALILAVLRDDGQAWSLANAFEKPVVAKKDNSILHQSVAMLDNHWHELDCMYGDAQRPAKPIVLVLPEMEGELKFLKEHKRGSLQDFGEAVCDVLPQE